MGAVVNGLTLHGLRGYASTFLIFSDYMRPPIRLAALMAIPSLFVFTHDSIGLGEDGPTHQPVEQLASLRAIPNLYVIRPADANETVQAWRFALAQTETPTALALSRQGLPVLDPELVPPDAIERGAYVLRDGSRPDPDVLLLATGSEVHPCLAAAELLEAEGIATRVVSMPCPERFAEGGREDARRGPSAGLPRASGRRGGEPVRLAPLGRRGRRRRGHEDLRRLRAGLGAVRGVRLRAGADRRARPGRARGRGRGLLGPAAPRRRPFRMSEPQGRDIAGEGDEGLFVALPVRGGRGARGLASPGGGRAGRRADLAPRRHAVGGGRGARGRRPARLARGARGVGGSGRGDRALRAGVPGRRDDRRGPARHGRVEPRARGRPPGPRRERRAGAPGRTPAGTGLGRSGGGARRGAIGRARAHAVRRLDQVRRHRRDALAGSPFPRAGGRAPRRRRHRQALRGDHRPGQLAARAGDRAAVPAGLPR